MIPLIKLKLLLKSNPGNPQQNVKEFAPTDVYMLNLAFHSQLYRIKLPVASVKENKAAEKAEVAEKVDEDRRHMVEATIVKVMKTRRKIEHNALIAEATKILS